MRIAFGTDERTTLTESVVERPRAALCTDAATAEGARRWNDANVPAFGLRLTSEAVAAEMAGAFLRTELDAGEEPLVARVEPGE